MTGAYRFAIDAGRRHGGAGARGRLLPAQPGGPRARAADEHVLARQEHERALRRLPARGARLRRPDAAARRRRVALAAAHQPGRDARGVVRRRESARLRAHPARAPISRTTRTSRPTTTCGRAPGWSRWRPGAAGRVRLVELHAPDETDDNIVAFWVPETLPAPGEPIELAYKLHWFLDQIHPPAGYVVATRHGRSRTQETGPRAFRRRLRRARAPAARAPIPAIEPVVTVGDGRGARQYHHPEEPVQRHLAGRLRAAGPTAPASRWNCAASCASSPTVLTETWSYLWQP